LGEQQCDEIGDNGGVEGVFSGICAVTQRLDAADDALDPSEGDLDLPAPAVELGDLVGGLVEVAGPERQRLVAGFDIDAPDRAGESSATGFGSEQDGLVGEDVRVGGIEVVHVDDAGADTLRGSRHELGATVDEIGIEIELQEAAIEDVCQPSDVGVGRYEGLDMLDVIALTNPSIPFYRGAVGGIGDHAQFDAGSFGLEVPTVDATEAFGGHREEARIHQTQR